LPVSDKDVISFLTQENHRQHDIILIVEDCAANCAGVNLNFKNFNLYRQLFRNQCLPEQGSEEFIA